MSKQAVSYGGQAVIEGVMMQGNGGYAIACRQPNGDIVYKQGHNKPPAERKAIWRWPFFRGLYSFATSMKLGFSCLSWSAVQAGEEEEEKLSFKDMALAIIAAVALVAVIFVVIPVTVGSFVLPYVGFFGRSVIEGVLRLGFFVGYVALIARMPDIVRVFAYHGAEHKTIATLEAGLPLTVENARPQSRIHCRCGTSFILMALILMIIIFTFVGNTTPGLRMLIKIAMMPVVAGVAFEIYRLPLKFPNSKIVRALVAPGMWLQHLTTNEPDDSQLEVAIASMLLVPGFPGEKETMPPRVYKEGETPADKKEAVDAAAPLTEIAAAENVNGKDEVSI